MHPLFTLRKQLLSNGYFPLPNLDKRCLVKGWNKAGRYGKLVATIERWDERYPEFQATGVLVRDGLLVLDADVDDEELAKALAVIIERIAPDVFGRAPVRYGSGTHKTAWFCRLDGPVFVRLGTRKLARPADLEAWRLAARAATASVAGTGRKRPHVDPPEYHHVEFFGGAPSGNSGYSRQFGAYGPHTVDDNGVVKIVYTWAGAGLHDTPFADLPTLTPDQIDAIRHEFTQAALALGWEEHDLEESDTPSRFVYDIDRATAVFELRELQHTVGYDDLAALYSPRHRTELSPSFIGDISTTYRCILGWSAQHDCAVVHDWKTGVTHLPIDVGPVAADVLAATIAECATLHGLALPEDHTQKEKLKLEDFYSFLPTGQYLFAATGALWVRKSIDSILDRVIIGTKAKRVRKGEPPATEPSTISASLWLDRHAAVIALTWAPALPQLIHDQVPGESGWIEKPGATTFNLYRKPGRVVGGAKGAGKWLDLVRLIYPDHHAHIIAFCAHCVQHPGVKINHALVLTGAPGIGKDTLLEPLRHAVGPWNFKEISPQDVTGKHNDYMRSVVLRISETRDLGELNRYSFYEISKTMIAAPPDMVRIDVKYVPQHYVPNVTSVIFTTNYPADGLYLPPEDRRHYVCATEITADAFDRSIWTWYAAGGINDVVAYLASFPLEDGFDAKAPPEKTTAFWRMVDAGRPVEESEVRDAIEAAGWPDAFTVASLTPFIKYELAEWIKDRKNSRNLSRRFDDCGYTAVRNLDQTDGRWKIGGKNSSIYAKKQIGVSERFKAAIELKKVEDELEKMKKGNVIPIKPHR